MKYVTSFFVICFLAWIGYFAYLIAFEPRGSESFGLGELGIFGLGFMILLVCSGISAWIMIGGIKGDPNA